MHAPVTTDPPRRPARSRIPRLALNGVAAATLSLSLALASCAPDPTPGVAPRPSYADVAAALETMIERERDQKGLAAMSIALVDDEGVAWATGFGEQSPGVPATASTVYRVGSVSKLFTDIAVMQLAERGEIDIDAPVRSYLPDFAPDNRSGTAITLRQLMSHRAGLIREPPSGNYFDDGGTDLAATIASLNGLPLIYEPEARIKYSNAGIAVVGYVLEVTRGEPFADYVKRAVIDPIGMPASAFSREPDLADDLARAYMWGFDRPDFDAPGFDLGMAPAGSMYSTVLDLARFMEVMFRRALPLQAATLEAMWEPQFADPGAADGYGLGFAVQERFGERWLGHGGAIYGFSTQLAFLPGSRLGVVVVSAVDGTNTLTSRVADAALELMLAARAGEPLPTAPTRPTAPLDPALALQLESTYGDGDGDDALELDARDGRLFMTPARGGATTELRARGDTLIVDDRLAFGDRFLRHAGGTALVPLGPDGEPGDALRRQPPAPRPTPPPPHWQGLIGEYGPDHNILYILERGGRLNALIEWFFLYPLDEVSPDVYAFPDWGLYHGEHLVFTRDANGRATSVEAASVDFTRRDVGTEAGGTFRIDPVRPVAELREEALAASPPGEPGPFRDSRAGRGHHPGARHPPGCALRDDQQLHVVGLLRRGARLPPASSRGRCPRAPTVPWPNTGYGLLLHDGYRPWYVTKMFFDATPESQKIFVADPASGSRHNRGSAIDLNLFDLATGQPADMVGTYDEFSPRSFPNYPGGTSLQRWQRELLRRAMETEGFTVYEAEWWHFDHDDWREYAIQNATFGELGR